MKNGNWKGVFSHDLCIFERELLKSSGQLCTVISTERSSFYKHYLCWHLNCCILRSYLSSHVILSSFPQYLTFWKSGVQTKRKKVWSVKKTRLWLFSKEIRQKGSHQCHFVPGLASGVLVGLPSVLFSPCNNSLRPVLFPTPPLHWWGRQSSGEVNKLAQVHQTSMWSRQISL